MANLGLPAPVSIAGIGAVTGYGWGKEKLWDGVLSGKPAAVLTPGYGPSRTDDVWLARIPDAGGDPSGASGSVRAVTSAVDEALTDARRRGWRPGSRVGLVHAVVLPEYEQWRTFYLEDDRQRNRRGFLGLMPSTVVSDIMQRYGFHGPAMNVSAMCASGNAGVLTAKMWLDTGTVDDVVLVTSDVSISPETVDHFVRLGVLVVDTEPNDACRPFQRGSRGFPAGEAGVAFVLTRTPCDSYADVLGGAMSHDAHHVTSIDPSLDQVRACVAEALRHSGIRADDVDYLNAHGPGTAQCDAAEAAVLDSMLPAAEGVYSVKPLVGHCQGAASAVETATAAMGYEFGIVPAVPRVAESHPRLIDGPTPMSGDITLKTSLGMGGHNSAIVLARSGKR